MDSSTFNIVGFIDVGEPVNEVAFSPDGTILATAGTSVRLWNPSNFTSLMDLEGSIAGYVSTLLFSPGGIWVAAMGANGGGGDPPARLLVWRTADGEQMFVRDELGCGHGSSFAFTADGRAIALQECGFRVSFIRALTGEDLGNLEREVNSLSIAFTPDGRGLLAGTRSGEISLISLPDEDLISSIPVDTHDRFYLSPNGATVVIPFVWSDTSGSWRSQLWELAKGRLVSESDWLGAVAFSPDSRTLVGIAEDGTVEFLDLESGLVRESVEWPGAVTAITFGRLMLGSGSLTTVLAAGTNQGTVLLIDPDSREQIRVIPVPQSPVDAVALHPSGELLAVATSDGQRGTIFVLDTNSGHIVRSFDFVNTFSGIDFYALAFSQDGTAIAARTSPFGEIMALRLDTGESIPDPGARPWFNGNGIGASQKGHLVEFVGTPEFDDPEFLEQAVDGFTDTLMMSTVRNDENRGCYFGRLHSLSENGVLLAIGCDLPWIEVWDIAQRTRIHELRGHGTVSGDGFAGTVFDLAFAPRGHVLASSGYDKTIFLWDAATGQQLRRLAEHMSSVNSITWSPDGRYLASASYDGTFRLWGLP